MSTRKNRHPKYGHHLSRQSDDRRTTSNISLSRLILTGPVDDTTPMSVLLEICDAHGISYRINSLPDIDQLVERINTTPVLQIEIPYQEPEYSAIARYVNNEYSWDPDSLIDSFEWIMSFGHLRNYSHRQDQDILRQIIGPNRIRYGLPQPNNTNAFNACILYACCNHCGIQTHNGMNPHEMAHYVDIFINGDVRRSISDMLSTESYQEEDLINFYIDLRERQTLAINDSDNESDNDQDDVDRGDDQGDQGDVDRRNQGNQGNQGNDWNEEDNDDDDEDRSSLNTNELNTTVPPQSNNSTTLSSDNLASDQNEALRNSVQSLTDVLSDSFYQGFGAMFSSSGQPITSSVRRGNNQPLVFNTPAMPSLESILSQPRPNPILSSPPRNRPDIKLNHRLDKSGYDHDSLDKAGKNIQKLLMTKSTQGSGNTKKITIDNIPEVLAVAALIYQIDLTDAENPIDEFTRLQTTPYRPKDARLKQRLDSEFPQLESIRLDVRFNPHLPRSFYCNSILRGHAINQGFIISELNQTDPYELLQLSYFLPTFNQGKLPNVTNERTAIMFEDIVDLDSSELVSYGSPDNEMRAFTYSELLDTFKRYRVFQDPSSEEGEYFSDRSIATLVRVSTLPLQSKESDENRAIRNELVGVCNTIRDVLRDVDDDTRNFIFRYEQGNSKQKKTIEDMVWSFHSLAMNMRGWSGEGPYPIIHTPVDNQNLVDSRCLDAVIDLERKVEDAGTSGEMFLNLPLLRFRQNTFSKATNQKDGLTLGQRLYIIRDGNSSDRIAACIRLTSNWFCSSIYRYMELLKIDPGFNITELVSIG